MKLGHLFFYISLLLILHSGSTLEAVCASPVIIEQTPEPTAKLPLKKKISEETSAEIYWILKKVGDISKETEYRDYLIYEAYLEGSGISKFYIRKDILQDPQAKTDGAKKAMQILIHDLKSNFKYMNSEHHELYDRFLRRIKSLTGLNFKYPHEWKEWFKENEEYLVWSDEYNRLIID